MNRNQKIDIVRGLAMITVVLGHSGFPYTQHLYLFHMSAFLFISGYCFNKKKVNNFNSLVSFLGRKVVQLYVPYALFNAILDVLHNVFCKTGIYAIDEKTIIKPWWSILNSVLASFHFEPYASEQLAGAAWFIIVLFEIVVSFSVLMWVIHLFIKNQHIVSIIVVGISIYFLYLGNQLRIHNIVLNDFCSTFLSCFVIYTMGFLIKEYASKVVEKKWNKPLCVIIIGFVLAALYLLEKIGHISLGGNAYPSPLFMLVCTITGILLLFSFAQLIENSKKLACVISYVGKKTLFILFLHFLSFKIVTIIQIIIYKDDLSSLSAFPHLRVDNGWWFVYAIFGIIIPLVIEKLWCEVKNIISELDKKRLNNVS